MKMSFALLTHSALNALNSSVCSIATEVIWKHILKRRKDWQKMRPLLSSNKF